MKEYIWDIFIGTFFFFFGAFRPGNNGESTGAANTTQQGKDPSGMMTWVTLPGKQPTFAKVLMKDREI